MSKKSSKDKSGETAHEYHVKDTVLAKIRGFPPWPGEIVDAEAAPPNVLKERPTKKTKFYCVRFFPAGDYSWAIAKDLSMLQKHEIEAYINEPHKKNGELLEGYKVALNPDKWHEEKAAQRLAADEEEAEAEVDQLEGEDELPEEDEDGKKPAKSNKRKREPEAKPKAKKANGTTEKKKKSLTSKKGDSKSAEVLESEDDTAVPSSKRARRDKEEEDTEDPETKKVKDWRHALQRIFLSPKTPPKDEDMPNHDKLFGEVEAFESITVKHLQKSKIGKVMRHIAALEAFKVPRDDEFKFRDRANALVERWHKIVQPGESHANGDSKMDLDSKVDSVAPNGDAVEDGKADVDMKTDE